ncbi:hypothetical protein ABHA33_13165, partial [Enterococcus faecium]
SRRITRNSSRNQPPTTTMGHRYQEQHNLTLGRSRAYPAGGNGRRAPGVPGVGCVASACAQGWVIGESVHGI